MRSRGGLRRGIVGVALAVLPSLALAQVCTSDVPHVTGSWRTLPFQSPINPISATLLRTGDVLLIAGSENDAYNHQNGAEAFRAAIWDPAGTDGTSFDVRVLGYDVFCSGTAQLPHGRVLIIGGTSDYSFTGEARATIFDPLTRVFAQSPNMADGRWYGSATTLADGRLLAFSGLDTSGNTSVRVEMFNPSTPGNGWGSPLNHTFVPPLYPRAFVLPNGKVYYSGHGSGASNSRGYILDPVARTWTNSASTTGNRQYGTVVMLPLYPPTYVPKIMAFGGGPNPAKKSTEIIDMSAATPAWTAGPNMSSERVQLGAVILPNGKVFVEGGSLNNETPDTGGKGAQIYSPSSNSFASAGTAAFSRLYHSVALLLPDATVATLGSNPGDRGKYLGAIEIYTPPYLFDADDKLITAARPQITDAPSNPMGYNEGFTVDYTSTAAIASAVLVRPGSTTHAFDMEQRMVGLCGAAPQPACSGSGGTLTLTTPLNGNVAPPGHYMLFLLDAAGVPSHARFIELSPFVGTSPDGDITSPASDVTINSGNTVNFGTTTVSPTYSWTFPGGSPSTSTAKNPGNVTYSAPGTYYATMTAIGANGDTDPSPPTRKITVRPTTAAFEISVTPDARTILPGGSTTYTVTVTPRAGFSGSVALGVGSEGGLPTGVSSGGFSPASITGSGSSTLTINTTTGAAPYALSLSITGTSAGVTHGTSTSLLVNLSPPASLQATPSTSDVQLSWLPSTGASSYKVFRGDAAGGGYDSLGCTNLTNFTDSTAAPGKTYYYVTHASYTGSPVQGGVSAPSAEVSAALICPPPGYSGTLSASRPGGVPTWSWTAGGAVAYDLVQGDLGTLRSSGGDFQAALDALGSACMANDTGALSLPDAAPLAEGEGRFALLRAVTTVCPAHGTVDDGSPSLIAPRDAGIGSASTTCP